VDAGRSKSGAFWPIWSSSAMVLAPRISDREILVGAFRFSGDLYQVSKKAAGNLRRPSLY
jgi:hypothetical protein